MALTNIRNRRSAPRARVGLQARTRGSRERPPPDIALTAGAAYDKALHGSALYVEKDNAQDIRRLIQPWQAQSMSYYDLVPEVKFATRYFSDMVGGVRLFPAKLDPDTHEPEEIHDGPVFDAFQEIIDPSGGRQQLQEQYARLRFLIGESYLTVSPDEERGQVWECLSPNELRVQPGGIATRFRAPMLSGDQYKIGVSDYIIGNDKATVAAYGEALGPAFSESGPDIIVVYRLWRPHPAYSWLADCNMRAAMDILEELVLSTYSVRAQLKSRMNQSGIFFVPEEMSFASLGNDPEEDPGSDVFQSILTAAMMAALSDPGSASSQVPLIARVAAEYCDKAKLVRFNDTQGELAEIKQRDEMIGRFATCIEIPAEILKGLDDVNHWTGWLIDEQSYKSYGKPGALEMASDLTAAYLQPAAREAGEADWDQFLIGVDPSEVINHPDRAKDADALYAGRAISKKVWRESKGYNDNDAMPDDERAEQIGVAVRDGSLAWYGIPSVKAGGVEPEAGVVESPAGESSAPTTSTGGSDVEKGPPVAGAPTSSESQAGPALQASAAQEREQRILGAAEMAIQRGRELAGAKLRSMTSARGPVDLRCAECQTAISGVPNWKVCSTLGAETVRGILSSSSLKVTGKTNLVDGAGQAFAAVLEQMGVTPDWASELGDLVEMHAARTLFDEIPGPLPSQFRELLPRTDRPLHRS